LQGKAGAGVEVVNLIEQRAGVKETTRPATTVRIVGKAKYRLATKRSLVVAPPPGAPRSVQVRFLRDARREMDRARAVLGIL
jgi:hypothetical protein